ncbi:ATP-binding protein [Synergistes jonesii]|uniref:ATP-binding protein n=1 Tax=Synergistes jonesii TaxID=2754 RepID=UPI00243240B6|nr:ATP-binding protein [Synergistes jonesii]
MKKLLILSGKGGTGKTTVAAAFIDFLNAEAFADCDVDAPNLHLVAGMNTLPERWDYFGSQKAFIDPPKCVGCGACLDNCRFDAIVLRDGICEVDEYACEGCGVCEYVCPQSAVTMSDDVAGEQMLYKDSRVFSTAKLKMGRGNSGKLVTGVKKALISAAPDSELAVIDGSPGVGCPVIASVSGVNLVLIVAEPSLSGIHDMERILKTAVILMAKVAVCVNKYDVCMEKMEDIERYCREKSVPFVGRIPFDKQASATINAGHSLASVDCPARDALRDVFKNTIALLGEDSYVEY